MNVDWAWAKQRPHFLAEHLSKSFDVVIFYPYSWRRSQLVNNTMGSLKIYPFFIIPLAGRFAVIERFNLFILKFLVGIFLKIRRFDYLWISSPELSEYLPEKIEAKLIYDCMDDVLEFPTNQSRKSVLMQSEIKLIKASSQIFCSSINLRQKLMLRGGSDGAITVLNNAFEPSSFSQDSGKSCVIGKSNFYVLGYVGTISSWLDFEVIQKVVEVFDNVEIHLLGPVENLIESRVKHERIKFLGAVSHSEIQANISGFDILIMPFLLTELILSVDPVKLYEYIFFNKPIVAIRYPEVDRFSDFVDFYETHEDFIKIISGYINGDVNKKYSDDDRFEFISKNSWGERVSIIEGKLN